jgi:hypothetical protein
MKMLTFLDRSDLDDDRRRAVAAWRADLEIIASEAARENSVVLACAELASLFAHVLGMMPRPNDASWMRVYALSARITKRAAGWCARSETAAAALRRLCAFVDENADLAVEGSPLAS